jgi:hypothetical protein
VTNWLPGMILAGGIRAKKRLKEAPLRLSNLPDSTDHLDHKATQNMRHHVHDLYLIATTGSARTAALHLRPAQSPDRSPASTARGTLNC